MMDLLNQKLMKKSVLLKFIMLGGLKIKDEILEKPLEVLGLSFYYLKGKNDGLEEIIVMLKENAIAKKQQQDVLKILSEYFDRNSNSESF